MKPLLLLASLAVLSLAPNDATYAAEREPYGIGLEGFQYPYPVQMLPLTNDGEQLRMAYMDVPSQKPNGRTVVLLHGRNFPSSYWAPVIRTLTDAGYRVVVPDQIGFGKSSKPSGSAKPKLRESKEYGTCRCATERSSSPKSRDGAPRGVAMDGG